MPLDFSDWAEIQKLIGKMIAERGEYFIQGVVVKNDKVKRLIWLKELGDQPIPLLAFDYQITYYFNEPDGGLTGGKQTIKRKTNAYSREVEVLVPKIGDMVLVAKHFGSRRLPKCLGVIKSTDYVGKGGE